MSERDSGDIQVIMRCAQILRQFEPGAPLRVSALVQELDVGRSTIHRYLNSMASAGLIERIGEGEYAPGSLLARLGTIALNSLQVVETAAIAMRELCDQLQLTVVLSIWGGMGPVVTRVVTPDQLIQILVRVGSSLPMSAAQMRIFLAYLDEPRTVERLLSLVPEQREAIAADCDLARTEGYLLQIDTVEGVSSIGVPVFNSTGIAATMAVLGTKSVIMGPRSPELIRELRAKAKLISEQLGFDGEFPGSM